MKRVGSGKVVHSPETQKNDARFKDYKNDKSNKTTNVKKSIGGYKLDKGPNMNLGKFQIQKKHLIRGGLVGTGISAALLAKKISNKRKAAKEKEDK